MSKRVTEWYVCDYCGKEINPARSAYTDNSGINSQCYDMCSRECMLKHLVFLREWITKNGLEPNITKWIRDHFWIKGRVYSVADDNVNQMFETEIMSIWKHWNSI